MSGTASDEYDPLNRLMRLRRALEKDGADGKPVGYQLQEVKNSIRSIEDERAAQAMPSRNRGVER